MISFVFVSVLTLNIIIQILEFDFLWYGEPFCQIFNDLAFTCLFDMVSVITERFLYHLESIFLFEYEIIWLVLSIL